MSTTSQNQVENNYEAETSGQEPVTVTAVRGAKEKAPSAFRTISEVADELDVPQHVLRFWETKFSQIKPLKRGGGRRYYRPEDVALLKRIHNLLYTEGYTIKGVQKLLKGQGKVVAASAAPSSVKTAEPVNASAATPVAAVKSAPVAVAGEKAAVTSTKPPLSDKQRVILEAMLGDLRDLRDMIRGNQQD